MKTQAMLNHEGGIIGTILYSIAPKSTTIGWSKAWTYDKRRSTAVDQMACKPNIIVELASCGSLARLRKVIHQVRLTTTKCPSWIQDSVNAIEPSMTLALLMDIVKMIGNGAKKMLRSCAVVLLANEADSSRAAHVLCYQCEGEEGVSMVHIIIVDGHYECPLVWF